MTEKQIAQFNHMLDALKTIARDYKTPEQLEKNSEKDSGLNYTEALEMSYENIQSRAKEASKGVRKIRPKKKE